MKFSLRAFLRDILQQMVNSNFCLCDIKRPLAAILGYIDTKVDLPL